MQLQQSTISSKLKYNERLHTHSFVLTKNSPGRSFVKTNSCVNNVDQYCFHGVISVCFENDVFAQPKNNNYKKPSHFIFQEGERSDNTEVLSRSRIWFYQTS